MIIPLTIIRKDNNTNFVKAGGFDGISIVRFFGGYAEAANPPIDNIYRKVEK